MTPNVLLGAHDLLARYTPGQATPDHLDRRDVAVSQTSMERIE